MRASAVSGQLPQVSKVSDVGDISPQFFFCSRLRPPSSSKSVCGKRYVYRSDPFFTVLLTHSGAMGLRTRQDCPRWNPFLLSTPSAAQAPRWYGGIKRCVLSKMHVPAASAPGFQRWLLSLAPPRAQAAQMQRWPLCACGSAAKACVAMWLSMHQQRADAGCCAMPHWLTCPHSGQWAVSRRRGVGTEVCMVLQCRLPGCQRKRHPKVPSPHQKAQKNAKNAF